jgi:hypothetical protein
VSEERERERESERARERERERESERARERESERARERESERAGGFWSGHPRRSLTFWVCDYFQKSVTFPCHRLLPAPLCA